MICGFARRRVSRVREARSITRGLRRLFQVRLAVFSRDEFHHKLCYAVTILYRFNENVQLVMARVIATDPLI